MPKQPRRALSCGERTSYLFAHTATLSCPRSTLASPRDLLGSAADSSSSAPAAERSWDSERSGTRSLGEPLVAHTTAPYRLRSHRTHGRGCASSFWLVHEASYRAHSGLRRSVCAGADATNASMTSTTVRPSVRATSDDAIRVASASAPMSRDPQESMPRSAIHADSVADPKTSSEFA